MMEKKKADLRRLMDASFLRVLDAEVLVIGEAIYRHADLVEKLGVGNIKAARNLTAVCKKLSIETVKALYARGPSSLLRLKGVGNATIWVAMNLLDEQGYSVEHWWGWMNSEGSKFSAYRERVRRKSQKKGARHEVD